MPHYNISGYQGSTYSLTFIVKNYGGTVFNLSGYSIRSAIRERYTSSTGIAEFTSSIVVPESGICSISLNATGMAALAPNIYIYGTEVYNSGGLNVIKPLEGYFEVLPDACF